MNFGDYITTVAKSAGIPTDNEHFVALMGKKEVVTAELPNEFVTELFKGLMTKETAVNNVDVINAMKSQYLNPIDTKLYAAAKDIFGLDESFITPLKETKGTYNRLDLFVKNLSDTHKAKLEEAKANPNNNTSEEVIQEFEDKIKILNEEIVGHKESMEGMVSKADHDEMISKHDGQILDGMYSNGLSGYNYVFKDMPLANKIVLAKSFINTELQKRGVNLRNEEGKFVLREPLADGSGFTKHMINNKEFTPTDLFDEVLSNNKLLMVNDSDQTQTQNQQSVTQTVENQANGELAPGAKAAYDEAMANNGEIIQNSQTS